VIFFVKTIKKKQTTFHSKFCNILKNSGESGISENPEFRKTSGKISEFRKLFSFSKFQNVGQLFGKYRVFHKNRSAQQCTHYKIDVKLINFVFQKNSPKMSRDVPEIPNSGKKKCVFPFSGRRKDTAYFWKIFGKNFRENPDVFGGKFPEIRKSGKFRKFRKISEKKVQNVDFGKFNPRCRARFKTHILRAKIDKKN
jgi:hypothetical protein